MSEFKSTCRGCPRVGDDMCMHCPKDPKNNPVLSRLINEVRIEVNNGRNGSYNRVHNRHNRG